MSDERVARVRKRLAESGVSAIAAIAASNVAYLTNFSGVFDPEPSSIALVSARDMVLFVDGRYAEAATAAALGTGWVVREFRDDPWKGVAEHAQSGAIESLAVEDSLPVGQFRKIEQMAGLSLEPLDGLVEHCRSVKSAEEIERIAAAQALTDATFDHILGFVRPGVTELEIALELEVHMRRQGSEGIAFPPIVASGPNSSLPHAHPTERELRAGDLLTLDFGARVDGYCADMTRTVSLGTAGERERAIYDAVLTANLAAIAACREGATGVQVDAAARSVIEERGFGDRFPHSTGHGVGLDVHELPSVSKRNPDPLEAGEVVTIEPGVYVPGLGGVRIEDLVVVEAAECRVLTASTRDLIEL